MLTRRSTESRPMARKSAATPTLPPFLKWRDERPRWEPSPRLRAAGWQGRDLKDEAGNWLGLWEACAAAQAINAEVGKDATEAKSRPAPNSLGALLDAVEALPKFREPMPGTPSDARRTIKRLSRDTRAGYLGHFQILRAWGERTPVGAITPADVEALYDALVTSRGHVMANRCMAAANMAFNHAVNKLRWLSHNPFTGLEKVEEDGRLVQWTADETVTFVRCADWMGLHGVGDAHIVGLCSAQSRIDILAMPELDLDADVFRLPRHKVKDSSRGIAYVPATQLLVTRLRQSRKRKAERFPGVTYRHEVIDTRTGAPYNLEGSVFTEQHRMVRAVASGLQQALEALAPDRPAAGHGAATTRAMAPLDYSTAPFTPMPTIWDKRFADLRDTAITMMLEACKGDITKVANMSAHSIRTVTRMFDKHYFVRNENLSRSAGGELETLMKQIGYGG